ncbi:glycosyltransferase family 32 protein [Methylovulum miyakonense]|uniref:glycosyltransferase family 32 protein n=1 Tax=Methylovulum miyakonense TaxID=645578 RepID=UPI0003A57262|nr:glycosyltransferase [Methylovulum miyakonense]
MKVCVMGNSHLAALKLAWDELVVDNNRNELVFFGARANAMVHMEIRNGCLFPTDELTKQDIIFTSGGLESIDFNGFDAVLLYGLACDVRIFSLALATHKLENIEDPSRQVMTQACFTRVCQDVVSHNLLYKLAAMVRSVVDLPIFISPSPFPSRECVNDPSKWDFLAGNYCQSIQKGYYDGIKNAFQALQGIMIFQPEDTITDFLFTKPHFSSGSIRLTEGLSTAHPADDYVHMNKSYGIEFLKDALNVISSGSIIKQDIPLLSVKDSIVAVERFQEVSSSSINDTSIPLRIFQYWDNDNPPDQVQTLIDRNRFLCKSANIDYVLLNDFEARRCLKKYFSEDVYKAYDLSPHPAMKCDLFRLCYLYQYGGFYLDADMVLTEKFSELFSIKGDLAVFKWDIHNIVGICNWLIGSIPFCPIIGFAIQKVSESIIQACENNIGNVLQHTLAISGPALFTRVIGSYIANKEPIPNEFSALPVSIEAISYGLSLVQNGPNFLKKPLDYRKTNLHWSVAAKNQAQAQDSSNDNK